MFDDVDIAISWHPATHQGVKTAEQHEFLDLRAGRVDFVMASTGYLMTSIKKPGNNDIVMTGPRSLGGFLGAGSSVGLRKSDPELKPLFNEAIEAARAEQHDQAAFREVVRI